MENKNIIVIRRNDIRQANHAFASFMQTTEDYLNERAKANPKDFKSISARDLELLSVDSMKALCPGTPFKSDQIELVSGQSFPDIIAADYYGVEVKSTKSDHWKSTGSSIVESTRNENVDNIYMLFGKLGGAPQFKCRPYQDCLYDITVTHSPRYLIDMNIGHNDTIFAKMGITYDEFRTSPDSIARVRRYYRDCNKQARKERMPWWLNDNEDEPQDMMLRQWKSTTVAEKETLKLQMYLLFPEQIIDSDYDEASMWLVAYHKIVCSNIRDAFSSGGQAKYINNRRLEIPAPAVVKRFLDAVQDIKLMINNMLPLIDIYNPKILHNADVYESWLKQVDKCFKQTFGSYIKFYEWAKNGDVLSLK